jgi:hypothetical protein
VPIDLDVTCIRKPTGHYDPHRRIEGIGGGGILGGWYHIETKRF